MASFINRLKGDKAIWGFMALLAVFSFMPVFSASSNLAYVGSASGNVFPFIAKHFVHLAVGFGLTYFFHKRSYKDLKPWILLILPLLCLLLIYTQLKGTEIGGANAARWIQIPFIGVSFQTSAFAFVALMVFVARYLAISMHKPITFKKAFINLWLPVGIVIVLILPSNFSTAAFMFAMVLVLVYIGQHPIKYIASIVGMGVGFLMLFFVLGKAFPDAKLFSRVHTWEARITRHFTDQEGEDNYQIERAKTAIASGYITGLGPGKSVQRHFLPQSSSDFIYAIIVEEYGIVTAIVLPLVYLLLLMRFIIAANKTKDLFGKLLVIGLGFPIIFQALINMGVAVELFPVTGQTLPLISSGGSSIWVTCISLGIILSVTRKEEEFEQEAREKEKLESDREAILQRVIDEQLAKEAAREHALRLAEEELERRSREGKAATTEEEGNPLDAIK